MDGSHCRYMEENQDFTQVVKRDFSVFLCDGVVQLLQTDEVKLLLYSFTSI